mgnify:CR=1 FL=1
MVILITGGAGFIGSNLIHYWLQEHSEDVVVNFDALTYAGNLANLEQVENHPQYRFFHGDLRNTDQIDEVFSLFNVEAVIHLAARAGVRQSVLNPLDYIKANVEGTLNVLENCKENGVGKFILASTSSVYGAGKEQPYSEESESNRTLSPYAASKKAAETLTYTYHHLYGFHTQVLRFFTVYGPAGRPDMAIFRFIKAIVEGEEVILLGDGGERDFTFVDDAANGVIKALGVEGYNVINLGSDRPIRITHVLELIEDMTGKRAKIKVAGRDPSDVPSTWADITKAKHVLGWKPETTIESGIGSTLKWYIANRNWARNIML